MELMWKYAAFRITKALNEHNRVPTEVYEDIIKEMQIRGLTDVDIKMIIDETIAYNLRQVQDKIKRLRKMVDDG